MTIYQEIQLLLCNIQLEDAVAVVCEDEREVIITYVSIKYARAIKYNIDRQRPDKAIKQQRLHLNTIIHMIKKILTTTFLRTQTRAYLDSSCHTCT